MGRGGDAADPLARRLTVDEPPPIHILALSTLFPDASRPQFGIFVERSMAALAAQPGIALEVVAPRGIAPWPLAMHPRYAGLRALPEQEEWHSIPVWRPRFAAWPVIGAKGNAAAVARAALPVAAARQRAGKLDVIAAQFFHPDGLAAVMIGEQLGVPVSIKARGTDIMGWGRDARTAPQVRRAGQSASGMLAVSEALRGEMIALGMPGERIDVHQTGVDAGRFHLRDRLAARAAEGLPADAPVLLTVGTLNAAKGQALVIEAMAMLPENTHYLIAGTGPDAEALKVMAERLGLATRVHFTGSVDHERLAMLYAAADAMVLPSAAEGLANAWVEAMASGTPVVAADIPSVHEVLTDPGDGCIVPREAKAMAGAVLDLIGTPIDRAALSARAHARFGWDRHGATLAAHLRALVDDLP